MQKQLLKDLIDWIENSSLEDLALRRLKLEELIGNTMGTEVQCGLMPAGAAAYHFFFAEKAQRKKIHAPPTLRPLGYIQV